MAEIDADEPPDHRSEGVPGWSVERTVGPAAGFHHRPLPDPVRPTVWIHRITGPALVLGSTQPDGVVDAARAAEAGVEVCRRRSGGGLVGLVPGNDLWIDLVIPTTSSLWDDDVGRAFTWVGQAWAGALRATLPRPEAESVEIHRGRVTDRAAGRLLCFAGLGPGEVTVAGRKVVGLSQRRTRTGARFQGAMTWRWNPDWMAAHVDAAALSTAGIDLDRLAIGLPDRLFLDGSAPSRSAVTDALLHQLPVP